MQWIDTNYVGAITKVLGNTDLFDDNRYKALMFTPSFRWHFQKSELYKHYFLVFSHQLNYITNFQGAERYHVFCGLIEEALLHFEHLRDLGIVFDKDSDDSHLRAWLTAANLFAADQSWR